MVSTTESVTVGLLSLAGIWQVIVADKACTGIPDVAAIGQNLAIYNKAKSILEGGTSASSPIFAAIITRINDERLRIGKKPVGFV